MCDALGTIIVDHLSKGELSSSPIRVSVFITINNNLIVSLKYLFVNLQEAGEPHELLELRQDKD